MSSSKLILEAKKPQMKRIPKAAAMEMSRFLA
jgi:hypothetical protein